MTYSKPRQLLTALLPTALVLGAWTSWSATNTPQDPTQLAPVERSTDGPQPFEPDFRQESVWRFSVLQIVELGGDVVEIPATLIAKLWVTVADQGAMRIEILYDNNDFQSVAVRDFTIVRVSTGRTPVEIPIVRDRLSGLAFPELR